MKNIICLLKNSLNTAERTKSIVAILSTLLIFSMIIAVIPVRAQNVEGVHGQAPTQQGYIGPITPPAGVTVNYTISPIAYISVSPNPIGVGQLALVNMWITFPSGEGKFMNGYVVTITKPDGTTETVNLQSYVADGTSWFNYIPTDLGVYRFQLAFPGEYYPAGYYSNGNYSATFVSGWIYNPSDYVNPATSQIMNLTVQQSVVASWDGLIAPAPTDYWSHPIEPNNRNWNLVAGNWPSQYFSNLGNTQATNSVHDEWYGPYVPAVNTPHIVWSKVGAMSGILGGDTGNQATVVGPSSAGPANTPSLIYMGRAYTTVTKSINGGAPQTYAECYDLQTGQIYYDILYYTNPGGTGITPTAIAYWAGTDTSVPGAAADAAYGVDVYTIYSGSANNSASFLVKINPNTGAVTSNITIPFITRVGTVTQVIPGSPSQVSLVSDIPNFFMKNGYILSFQWKNSTTSIYDGVAVTLAYNGYMVNWTEQGTTSSFAPVASGGRLVSNISVTLPESFRTLYEPNFGYGYGAYDPDTGISITQHRFMQGGFYGDGFVATSLVTGQVLWNITTDKSEQVDAYRPTNGWCRNGIYAYEMERGFIQARSETTGKIIWNTTISDPNIPTQYPWGIFWMYDEAAYGQLLYAVGYTGTYCLNETNGAIVWHYADVAVPFETPYSTYDNGTYQTDYSVQDIRVMGTGGADGIVYVSNSEHTPTLPPTRGWGLMALNATTGQLLWKIMGTRMSVAAASSGYIAAGSNYDGKLYILGKGKSATTVSAPQTQITVGTTAVIIGTVLDMSPNQPSTPCVSDASMATWMDYLNMQMPIDGLYHNITVTGVPISINTVDSNNNFVHIGDTTSDVSGTYSFKWTPTIAGDYKISATFAGTNAYGSSYAETAATVVNAPVASPTPTAPSNAATAADVTTNMVAVGIAIIIAIAIVGALILRKK